MHDHDSGRRRFFGIAAMMAMAPMAAQQASRRRSWGSAGSVTECMSMAAASASVAKKQPTP